MRTSIVSAAVLVALAAGHATMQGTPGWYQWRGPNRDGHSAETGLLKTWPSSGPPLVWRTTGAGTGYSSFSASGGRLYTLGARGQMEFVIAFDEATGKTLWQTSHGRRFDNEQGDGPRSTPTVDGDRLYALGASGDLSCLDAATGKMLWTRNLFREFGGQNAPWGISESPLVTGDRVLVNAGGRNASVVALDKATGTALWRSQNDEAAYSSAVLAQVGGVPQAIFFTARRALGIDPRDGRLLWSYDRVSNDTANIATPVVRGNRVFLSSDYGTGAALLELSPSGAREVYFTRDMRNHHSSSVLVGEYLYGFSGSILTAMLFRDGSVAWRDRSVGKGSVIYADERLYLYSENGVVGLAEASPKEYREHGRFRLNAGSAPTWAHPIIAGGKLILRDQDNVYAYDVKQK
jgi:outer membrane protein assembly factor BamB